MFFDEAKIYVKAGDGGNGIVAFRREKHVPFGGPAGGDGGKGGNVYLVVDSHLNTLVTFRHKVHFKAERGRHGRGKNQTGRSGANLHVSVPPGTIVRDADTGEFLGDLTRHGQELLAAQGGRGGLGNAAFASSVNQAPRIAEQGDPGEERWLTLELKLIADVGIVGLPNAGKSTLLSVVSAARPKIADYPFTTLVPNLGVVELGPNTSFVLADLPGLIGGAHQGVGLGHQFLRHVERTRLLIHLLDGASPDPLADYETINTELDLYSERLATRPQIVVLNKMDLPDAQALWPLVQEALAERGVKEVMAIAAVTHQGVNALMRRVAATLETLPREELTMEAAEEVAVFELPSDEDAISVTYEEETGAWRVRGIRVERAARRTNWQLDEAIFRFHLFLESMGVISALEEAGVQVGDTVFIGDVELTWEDWGAL
ncbi:MAG: GTPase ObgE [Anaerolineae bacterium]|nr:MAG: GTPase ObgE [Anaerolineae bacterium]